jgi:hypothetical protein
LGATTLFVGCYLGLWCGREKEFEEWKGDGDEVGGRWVISRFEILGEIFFYLDEN